jgi:DNA-directed RNA polymerase specialized sigma24 family protein
MRWWQPRGKKRHIYSREKNPSDWLLVAVAKRYPEAFRALYDRHFQSTYRLVYEQVGNEALAQELTSQVFTQAERLIKVHRQAGSFRSWLRTLAMRTVARHRGRGPDADRGLQSAGCPAPLRPIRPALSAAVALPLPPVDYGPGIVYALGRRV